MSNEQSIQEWCGNLNQKIHEDIYLDNFLLPDEERHSKAFTSLDLIEDSQSAIEEFLDLPNTAFLGRSTLYIYGLLQALYCQQDGLQYFFEAEGNMQFLGRKDHQVKIRGYRVELGEIEHHLQNHENIKEAAVNVFKDSYQQNTLCAYIVSKEPTSAEVLKEHLIQYLPSYMIPAYFIELDHLPLNANGKVDRKALPRPLEDGVDFLHDETEYVAHENELQASLIEIWKDTLGRKTIGIKHNFFQIGGDSLKAIQAMSHISKAFEYKIEIHDLFTYPTVESLANFILRQKQMQEEKQSDSNIVSK